MWGNIIDSTRARIIESTKEQYCTISPCLRDKLIILQFTCMFGCKYLGRNSNLSQFQNGKQKWDILVFELPQMNPCPHPDLEALQYVCSCPASISPGGLSNWPSTDTFRIRSFSLSFDCGYHHSRWRMPNTRTGEVQNPFWLLSLRRLRLSPCVWTHRI